MRTFGGLLVIPVLCSLNAVANAAPLSVVVTSVSGQNVFIDHGRASGITPDMRVRFFPPGAASVEGIVVDVSSNSARIEMYQGGAPPPVGTLGEIQLPEVTVPTTTQTGAGSQPGAIPEHPPWIRQEGARTDDMPLLAPAFSRPPSQRPAMAHGRIFSEFDLSTDRANGRDSQYYLGRAGTAFTVTNPFHQGGEFRLDAEFDRRGSDLSGADGTGDDDFIVNELSYAIGTEQYSPYRLEMGRFTSYYLPEIGLVDGLEGAIRLQNGLNLGAGVGSYPRDFPQRDEGDDLGFHIFLDYRPDGPNQFSGAIGFQKTWHNGAADRDVLVAHADAWLTKSIWVYGSATVDVYTAGDAIKSAGPGLTSAWFQARYTPDPIWGASVSISHYTWADVQQKDFTPVPPELIKNGRVDRAEASVWHDFYKDIRATTRVYYLSDQTDDGFGAEQDLDWVNFIRTPLELHGAVFYTDGSFTRDMGFRTETRYRYGNFDLFAGYEFERYTATDSFLGDGDHTRHTVRGGVGWQFGNWYLNVTADHFFGSDDDAYSINSYAEYRF